MTEDMKDGRDATDDTDAETKRVMLELMRRAPAWRKIRQVSDMNEAVNQLMRADILKHDPHISEPEMRRKLASRRLPPDLFREVYGARGVADDNDD